MGAVSDREWNGFPARFAACEGRPESASETPPTDYLHHCAALASAWPECENQSQLLNHTSAPNVMVSSAAQPRSRPWYRLHASSWVLLAILLGFVGLVNASGYVYFEQRVERDDAGRRRWPADEYWRYGWPFTYLTRSVTRLPQVGSVGFVSGGVLALPRATAIDTRSTWALTQNVRRFQLLPMAADVFIGLVLALLIALAFEWRRRRRPRLLSFSLKDLFAFALLIAVALVYWQHLRAEQRQLQIIVGEIGRASMFVDDGLPRWLQALLPDGAKSLGNRIAQIELYELKDPQYTLSRVAKLTDLRGFGYTGGPSVAVSDTAAQYLSELKQLVVLDASRMEFSGAGGPLASLTRLEELHIGRAFVDSSLAQLGHLTRLEHLTLRDSEVTCPGLLAILGELPSLQRLTVSGKMISAECISEMRKAHPKLELPDDSPFDDLFGPF